MGNADPARGAAIHQRVVAPAPGRLDAILAAACPAFSRARIQRLIAEGHVRLNGVPARKSDPVVTADVIDFIVPPAHHDLPDVHLELPVLWEDESLLVVNKPAGLAVHGAPGDTGPSVAAWMLARLGPAADAFDVDHPGIVHRLDKDTSGVLLLAKTPWAQAALSAAFESRAVTKTYLAVTDGVPDRARAIIDAPIARHPSDRTRMAVTRSGRASRTSYEVLGSGHGHALLLVHPETGRTHQIRVHLAAIGCPVTFDRVYGNPGPGRQLLHAWRIVVPHPDGGMLDVSAPLTPDFAAFVRASALETLASGYMVELTPRRLESQAEHRES